MKKLFIIAAALAFTLLSPLAEAQGGYFGVGTFSTQVLKSFNTGSGFSTFAISNVGQSSHWLTFCVASGSDPFLTYELDGSFDGSTWFAISEVGDSSSSLGCQILEASGYFSQLRLNLLTHSGGAIVNAWYSATQTAIESNGLMRGGKGSQPVTYFPSGTVGNVALKSTPATISTSSGSIYSINVFNPNAAPVFLVLSQLADPVSGARTGVYGIAAGQSINISLPTGISALANSTMACATSALGTGDPATGCVVTIHFKQSGTAAAGGGSFKPQIPN